MKILIITGGSFDEREISLLSSKNVVQALKKKHHKIEVIDFNKGYIEILKKAKCNDVIFPVLHGPEGEGGRLQKILEKNKIKFVGSGSKACELGWNKIKFKTFCKNLNIKTPDWFILSDSNVKDFKTMKIPFVIKPIDNGSSVDVFVCKSKQDLQKIDIKKLLTKYEKMMIEDYIEGVEITVGIFNKQALPIVEIVPPNKEWFNYENKYSGKTKELPNAPSLTQHQQQKIKNLTLKIHRAIECRHFSRTDYIVNKNGVFVLEINTIPGLTKESLLPKAAEAAGITFKDLANRLVESTYKD
ncbi:MAG: D-alanine--D-alanine ligase [bacterium]